MTTANNRLRVLRAEKRWNQREVAKRLGVGLDRYWKIENGHTDPDPKEQVKLARIFGVRVEEAFPQQAA